jgi:hypothetical protein
MAAYSVPIIIGDFGFNVISDRGVALLLLLLSASPQTIVASKIIVQEQ